MADSIKNVVLIGAGGNLGPAILEAFLKSSFKVTVFSRQNSQSTFPSTVTVVKTDYSAESLEQQFKGQDAVVSITGSEGFQDQQKIIDAAVKAGVKRFLPSEFGTNTADERAQKIVPLFATKKTVVDYLKSKESDHFSWTALITGPFFDWGLKVGFTGFDLKEHSVTLWDGGNTPVSESTLAQVGRAVVAVLSPDHVAETRNQYVYIDSFTVTQNEVLKTLEKVTGKNWTIKEEVRSEDVIPRALEKVKQGDYSSVPPLILASVYHPDQIGNNRKVPGGLWNDKFGLPKEDLEEVTRAVVSG